MENYKDNEGYSFHEIVNSLREYLKEGYNILNEMKSLIDVTSNAPYKVEIKVAQDIATNFMGEHIHFKDTPYQGEIYVFISKSRFTPARAIRNYITAFEQDTNPLFSIDNANFTIEKKGNSFNFKPALEHNIKRTYRPLLKVKDNDKFLKLYQRLIDEGYLLYPSILWNHDLSYPDFTFALSSQHININLNPTENKGLGIYYFPSDDSLVIKDNRKNKDFTIEDALNIKIPKRDIYKGYAAIIDRNLNSGKLPEPLLDLNIRKRTSL